MGFNATFFLSQPYKLHEDLMDTALKINVK